VRWIAALAALALTGCQTANGADWLRNGSGKTGYRQAERTCLTQSGAIEKDANRRDFFIGCMGALGWAPKPGASIEL